MIKGRILPLIGISIGLLFTFFGARAIIRAFESRGWPTTTGSVTYSHVETSRSRRSVTYRPIVNYRYTVDGKEYSNDVIAFAGVGGGIDAANDWVKRYPRGASADVHYAPDDPSISCLAAELPGLLDYLFTAAGLAMTVIGVLSFVQDVQRSRAKGVKNVPKMKKRAAS